MYNFFVKSEQIEESKVTIIGHDVNHIKNVLRMRVGEEICVSDGLSNKEYRCGILSFEEDRIICQIRFILEEGEELPIKVTLFQGLPKGDKMDLIIQKCVELGVHDIVPVRAARSITKLDEKKSISKIERWQAIAEAAAKQSKRKIIPVIHQPVYMREALSMAKTMTHILMPYELATDMQFTREAIGNIKDNDTVAVFIGPEGGFETEEVESAKKANAIPITLGKRILRTETAGLTVMAWLMYIYER